MKMSNKKIKIFQEITFFRKSQTAPTLYFIINLTKEKLNIIFLLLPKETLKKYNHIHI